MGSLCGSKNILMIEAFIFFYRKIESGYRMSIGIQKKEVMYIPHGHVGFFLYTIRIYTIHVYFGLSTLPVIVANEGLGWDPRS